MLLVKLALPSIRVSNDAESISYDDVVKNEPVSNDTTGICISNVDVSCLVNVSVCPLIDAVSINSPNAGVSKIDSSLSPSIVTVPAKVVSPATSALLLVDIVISSVIVCGVTITFCFEIDEVTLPCIITSPSNSALLLPLRNCNDGVPPNPKLICGEPPGP